MSGGTKEIFLAMDHPHVASLVDVYESDEQLFLVMESWKQHRAKPQGPGAPN